MFSIGGILVIFDVIDDVIFVFIIVFWEFWGILNLFKSGNDGWKFKF